MANRVLEQVRRAVANLNPEEVRGTAERPLAIRLVASSMEGYAAIEDFLFPPSCSQEKRNEHVRVLHRAGDPDAPGEFDLEIYEQGVPRPEGAFSFSREEPDRLVAEILERREELGLPLARRFAPFRGPVAEKIISSISKENALFSLITALPNIAPGLVEVPWALAEAGSDTAFLTVNQIRMLFLLAGASDRPIGYREQRAEIASTIAGAFGWRSVARELVGKVPFGGGIVPKAAVAFAGTWVVGRSAERLYRIGYGLTRRERRLVYQEAFERGKKVAGALMDRLKSRDSPPADVFRGRERETGPGSGG